MSNQSNTTEGGSNHTVQEVEEPKEFKIQILPAGSAPKAQTHQPDVNGELAAGQPNLSSDETFKKATEGSKIDVQKGLASDGENKKEKDEARHEPEIKSATEKEPEIADTL